LPIKSFYGLNKNMTSEEITGKILNSLLEEIKGEMPGVIEGKNDENLHNFRVAVRRTKTLLKIFRKHLSGDGVYFKKKLTKIMKETQRKRDLDVLIKSLDLYVEEEKEEIKLKIEKEIRIEQGRILSIIGSREFNGFLADLEEAVKKNTLFVNKLNETEPAEHFSLMIKKTYKKLRIIIKNTSLDNEELHILRLVFKEFRYILEFSADVLKQDMIIKIISDVKKIQEALGAAHDKIVQINNFKKSVDNSKAIRSAIKKALDDDRKNIVELTEGFDDDKDIKSFIRMLNG
jgi:CHAD domain-containing protein